jgi:DNA-directed RNA polymerase subunit RPC12/RpoP
MSIWYECCICGKRLNTDEEIAGQEDYLLCLECAKELPEQTERREE